MLLTILGYSVAYALIALLIFVISVKFTLLHYVYAYISNLDYDELPHNDESATVYMANSLLWIFMIPILSVFCLGTLCINLFAKLMEMFFLINPLFKRSYKRFYYYLRGIKS